MEILSISHVGSSVINSSSQPLYLNNIRRVLQITKNLINVSKFTRDNNIVAKFFSDYLLIKDKSSKQVLLRGMLKDGLYQLDISKAKEFKWRQSDQSEIGSSQTQRCFSSTVVNKSENNSSVEDLSTL